MMEAFVIAIVPVLLTVLFTLFCLWRIEVWSRNFWKSEHDKEADAKWAALEEVSRLRARLAAIRVVLGEGEPS